MPPRLGDVIGVGKVGVVVGVVVAKHGVTDMRIAFTDEARSNLWSKHMPF